MKQLALSLLIVVGAIACAFFNRTPSAGLTSPLIVDTTPASQLPEQDAVVNGQLVSETSGSGESLTNEDATYGQHKPDELLTVRTVCELPATNTPQAEPRARIPATASGRPVYHYQPTYHRRRLLPWRR